MRKEACAFGWPEWDSQHNEIGKRDNNINEIRYYCRDEFEVFRPLNPR